MSDHSVRFMAAADSGVHSQSWKAWVRGNDCYLGTRRISHEYKVSFHESGQCHIGLSKEVRKTLIDDPSWQGKSRLFSKWAVETELLEGEHVKLFEMLFPHSHLDAWKTPITGNELLLSCEPGQIASVAFYRASIPLGATVESEDQSVAEVARLPLENGHSIVVLYRWFEESEEHLHFFEQTALSFRLPGEPGTGKGRTYATGKIDRKNPNSRAMLSFQNDGGRYWVELSNRRLWQQET